MAGTYAQTFKGGLFKPQGIDMGGNATGRREYVSAAGLAGFDSVHNSPFKGLVVRIQHLVHGVQVALEEEPLAIF